MQEDFHYYATYCAAYLAGYSHEESLDICYCAQFVDLCSTTFLSKIKAPTKAATTQLQLEMMDARTDIIGLQDITRIWASFHFLPRDLYAYKPKRTKRYLNKFRLICGPNGDLYIEIRVRPHKYFHRDGNNIHISVPISAVDATLGTVVDVPTAYGDVELTIPAGTQPGQQLRIRGYGIKDLRTKNVGDQYVEVQIEIPKKLSREEKELYERLANRKKESVFEKFKKSFK